MPDTPLISDSSSRLSESLERLRDHLRTEQAYWNRIKRFIFFNDKPRLKLQSGMHSGLPGLKIPPAGEVPASL